MTKSFQDLARDSKRVAEALAKLDRAAGPNGENFDNVEATKILLAETSMALIELSVAMDAVKLLGCAKIMAQEGPLREGDPLKFKAFDENFARFIKPYAQALHAVATMAGVKLKPLPHPFCDDDEPKGTIQ